MKSLIFLSVFVTAVFAADLPPEKQVHIEGRITNGTIAAQGMFPYQVGLSLHIREKGAWCGGTIISDRWILTAAHCTHGVDGATVYFGAFDIENKTEAGQQRIYCSKKNFFIHKGYKPPQTDNDIALIKLPMPIEFNENIKPAKLPKKSEKHLTYEGELVVASGWGKDSDKAKSVTRYLQYIEVPVMSQSKCTKYYFNSITNNMICIETKNKKSICNGDSGGPLVYRNKGVNYVIGATSFGIFLGCEKGWPGVFARVTSYLDWIEEISGVVNK